jgi:hypothetical protein
MPPRSPRCTYCLKRFPTESAVSRHVQATLTCREGWIKDLKANPTEKRAETVIATSAPGNDASQFQEDFPLDFIQPSFEGDETASVDHPVKRRRLDQTRVDPEDLKNNRSDTKERYVESYPRNAGTPVSPCPAPTWFETLRDTQHRESENRWSPFLDEKEWHLALWLLNNVGHKAMDDFLKLPIVSITYCPGFAYTPRLWIFRYSNSNSPIATAIPS